MGRCGCSSACSCLIQAGAGVTVTGNGSTVDPYTIGLSGSGGGLEDCADLAECMDVSMELGASGRWGVKISADPGNAAAFGSDGGLFASAGGGGPVTVATGAGLVGNGSISDPVRAAVSAWPYPCSVDDEAGLVFVDSAGLLRSEARGYLEMFTTSQNQDYADLPVPTSNGHTELETRSLTVTNPDPCRAAMAIVETELDVDFVLPPNGRAGQYMYGDETARFENQGTSTVFDVHVQTTKVVANTIVPPGATQNIDLVIGLGWGRGGATYNRIQSHIRAVLISL